MSWTHLCELVKIDDSLERSFYAKQAVIENWSTTELKRQKKAALFLRLAASKDKEGILHLAKQGQSVFRPEDVIRDPYILDFLKIPELYHYSLSKYQLYLPNKEELRAAIEETLNE